MNIIKSNPMIKQEEIVNMINRSLRTVKTRMNEMQGKGPIARKKWKMKRWMDNYIKIIWSQIKTLFIIMIFVNKLVFWQISREHIGNIDIEQDR